jgi:hypothetical protein
MVSIVIRALSTVVTVLVAVAVAAQWGESPAGKILAAVVIAVVIAVIEGGLLWAPRHSVRVQQLLDPRSIMLGVWVQRNLELTAGDKSLATVGNSFSVYTVEFDPPNEYKIDGRAYDSTGREVARWWSDGSPLFGSNGREMTYIFDGTLNEFPGSAGDPDRTGVVKVWLGPDGNTGRGRVDHVAERRRFDFDLYRVTEQWLAKQNLNTVVSRPGDLRNLDERRRFAAAYGHLVG